jgi:hypothetical protein
MAPTHRPYRFCDIAASIFSTGYRRVDARIVFQSGGVGYALVSGRKHRG